jgi:hypothetical protein
VLGTTATVPAPDGQAGLPMPPGTQSGAVLAKARACPAITDTAGVTWLGPGTRPAAGQPGEHVLGNLVHAEIVTAIGELPPRHRLRVYLAGVNDLSHRHGLMRPGRGGQTAPSYGLAEIADGHHADDPAIRQHDCKDLAATRSMKSPCAT